MCRHFRTAGARVNYEYLATEQAVADYCDAIARAGVIAFDTEFVSEDRYHPELCLIQVAASGHPAIIDPLAVADLTPFWKLLAAAGHVTVVHAGREEFRFCRRAIQARPAAWFDTQIASGLVGIDYPASYSTLLQKLLGQTLGKGETRTNWRRRPLSKRQLEYALQDVLYLEPLYERLQHRLDACVRQPWLADELSAWQDQLEQEETTERWRRVAGIAGLSRRQLAILYELWRWRDQQARARDIPPRRVLRDDLLLELARRASADEQRIRAVRGMDWRKQQRSIPELAACVARGLAVPDEQCPRAGAKATRPQYGLLGQFLATAVSAQARSAEVAPGLIGSVEDVRDLIAYQLGEGDGTVPPLARGWRKEVVGQVVQRLLTGELVMRIRDPHSPEPLVVEEMRRATC
ncbi:MAG: ribonuclease D [Pirellulaceae bacterium]|nr:ribonuclease D [Pirellulaceae bacterium]